MPYAAKRAHGKKGKQKAVYFKHVLLGASFRNVRMTSNEGGFRQKKCTSVRFANIKPRGS